MDNTEVTKEFVGRNAIDSHRMNNDIVNRLKNSLEPRKSGQKESPRKYKNKTIIRNILAYLSYVCWLLGVGHWTIMPECITSK